MPPLVPSLIAFAAGTVLLQWQAAPPDPRLYASWGLALLVAATVGNALCRRGRADGVRLVRVSATLAMTVAAGLLGFGTAAWRAESALAQALAREWEGRDIEIVGVVDELPAVSATGARFAFAVERVLTPGAAVPPRISLGWFASRRADDSSAMVPGLRAAERWQLVVRLKRPHGNVNPHGFDLEAWLIENGLRATGYVRESPSNRRLDTFAGRVTDYIQSAREAVRDRALAALLGATYTGVVVALAIGEQRGIPESQWLVFNRTGISHLISISGLHVTVFAALAAAMAYRLARQSTRLTTRIAARRVAALTGSLAAFAYVLLAGSQVPAQRTLIMLIVAALGLWLGRPGTARVVWLWALAAVLAIDPWASLAPGFWLSFGAVGLLLYAGTGRLRVDASTRWQAISHAMRSATHAQLVVTVGLVPFTLALFQQVSLVAPLANALAIPVVTFAVVPLALIAVLAPLDAPWQLAHAIFALLMQPLGALAQLPAATWQQHAPATWTILAAIAAALWMLAPRGIPLRPLSWLWLLPLFIVRPLPPPFGSARVTVLDVGQGLAVLVQTHGHALLYDTGPRFTEDVDAGGRIIAPFLRAAGVTRLSQLVVSHLDSDHSGGTRTLLQTVPVGAILSSVPRDHPLFDATGPPVQRCVAGEHWWWDGVRFELLHPPASTYAVEKIRTNDLSCVLRIDTGRGSAMIAGDIEAKSESAMRAGGRIDRADVLVVPHHGSRTSSTPDFVAAVAPKLAVFTAGYRNRFGHPREEVLDRYRAVGARLARTDRDGAVTIDLPPLAWEVQRARDRRYWYDPPQFD